MQVDSTSAAVTMTGHGMAVLNSQLFIFGGEGPGGISGKLFRLTLNPDRLS